MTCPTCACGYCEEQVGDGIFSYNMFILMRETIARKDEREKWKTDQDEGKS
jgi:hypothetical protein